MLPSEGADSMKKRGLVLVALLFVACLGSACDFQIIRSQYDPDRVCPGETIISSYLIPAHMIFSVDMDGEVLWSFNDDPFCLGYFDFEILDNGNILYQCPEGAVGIMQPPPIRRDRLPQSRGASCTNHPSLIPTQPVVSAADSKELK